MLPLSHENKNETQFVSFAVLLYENADNVCFIGGLPVLRKHQENIQKCPLHYEL